MDEHYANTIYVLYNIPHFQDYNADERCTENYDWASGQIHRRLNPVPPETIS